MLTMDMAHGAVLVIDMQNDFANTRWYVRAGGIDLSPIQKAIGRTRRVVAAARGANDCLSTRR